jgi:hypothetical protein
LIDIIFIEVVRNLHVKILEVDVNAGKGENMASRDFIPALMR